MYEVTNERYAAFLNAQGNDCEDSTCVIADSESIRIHEMNGLWSVKPGFNSHPVTDVTWYGASAFCKWVGGRLPTEAEWEKAAKGAEEHYNYPWGDIWISNASNWRFDGDPFDNSENPLTTPVGYFDGSIHSGFQTADGRSPYGLYDMAGNAFEWVNDWYNGSYYSTSPSDNPQGPPESAHGKGLRGGNSGNFGNDHSGLRTALRFSWSPDAALWSSGFRCARDICADSQACLGTEICPLHACHEQGVCEPSTGFCACDSEHMNDDCSQCEDGYAGYPDCVVPSVWMDPASGLTWQNPPPDVPLMWQDAMDYCSDLVFDEHNDWRLPSISELRTLVQGCPATAVAGTCNVDMTTCSTYTCRSAACDGCVTIEGPRDGCYLPDGLGGACTSSWSSSEFYDTRTWAVQFDRASVDYLSIDHASMIPRCVRGTP